MLVGPILQAGVFLPTFARQLSSVIETAVLELDNDKKIESRDCLLENFHESDSHNDARKKY